MGVRCPICQSSESVQKVGNTHYICKNVTRKDHQNDDGSPRRPQFTFVVDDTIHFPYNQIFVKRKLGEFYRVPYLKLRADGIKKTT